MLPPSCHSFVPSVTEVTFTHAKCMIAQALTFTNCAVVSSPPVLTEIAQISLLWLSCLTSRKRGRQTHPSASKHTHRDIPNKPQAFLGLCLPWRERERKEEIRFEFIVCTVNPSQARSPRIRGRLAPGAGASPAGSDSVLVPALREVLEARWVLWELRHL